jgi:sulfite exporter TauE/SafE
MNDAIEALVLGFGSGPICLASCGPVLLPWLAMERVDLTGTARSLSVFLGGRLAGYFVFALFAWLLGMVASTNVPTRAWIFGAINLALAAILAWHAWLPWKSCPRVDNQPNAEFYQIAPAKKHTLLNTAVLGFLTGTSLCPPFVAAGVRAAELHSLSGALTFFFLFFIGTAPWFLPSMAVSPLRRAPAAAIVARMTLGLIAAYYAYLGILSLYGRFLHGN